MGSPPKESEKQATVTVRVERNLKCPAFRSATYSANINHDDDVDDEVITVTAQDDDDKVLQLIYQTTIH